MKKLLTVLLTLFMVFTLVGCNSKQDTPVVDESIKQEEVVEQTKEEPEVVGGYVDVEDGTLTNELKDIFNKALEDLTGATYEPQELVATQVVAGTNYKFLANGTKTTNPVTKGTYYITIYEDLQGNVELKDIEVIEEKQEEIKTQDVTQMYFWIVFYDQNGNELQRTAEKYGTIPSFKGTLPEGFINWKYKKTGKDVTIFLPITTNTYLIAVCNTTSHKSSDPTPTPAPMTIGDVLATVEDGFPTYDTSVPANAWVYGDFKCWKESGNPEDQIVFGPPEGMTYVYRVTRSVTKDGNNWKYTNGSGSTTLTFNMEGNVLKSITYYSTDSEKVALNGTYAPQAPASKITITLSATNGYFCDTTEWEPITSIEVTPGSSYKFVYSTVPLIFIKDAEGVETLVASFWPDLDNGYIGAEFNPAPEEYTPITGDFTITGTGTTCFVAGTQVQYDLAGNTKNIEDFKVGDDIVSYNVNTGEYYLAKVNRLFIHDGAQQTTQLVDMTLENGTVITMTANHPILTQDGFKSVSGKSALTAEDKVLVDGEWIDISDIKVYSCDPTTTYNIDVIDLEEIEDDNTIDTYIAGGAVVHNKPE